ncbi:site-specific integrase [Nitratireductor sp. GZWM139]|uniref:site-specific integrase n=1 Tax=Nitratireductor sp. GZWM139 TaxID=2950541 RepID=UPI0024BDFE43|nr:site-specific integrase [Nitratireductor sp. GZWM139]MDJ1464736.1 tyrosine-type recombinase/integrase [Nitratireductor sp. GZWM139]
MTASEKVKLTDALVSRAAAPADRAELMIWDSEVAGFGLRVRGDSKSFIIVYRPVGAGRSANMKRLKIGTPGTLGGVKEARRIALSYRGKIADGEDPAAERAEEKRRAHSTVAELLDRYEKRLERRGYVNRKDVMSLLRRRLRPFLARDIAGVKGWELAELIERLDTASNGRGGSDFRSRCNPFLNWCVFDARVLDVNPLAGYRRGRDTRQERVSRAESGRALADAEIVAVWNTSALDRAFYRLVRFLLLTGCRRSEGAKLLWDMVDVGGRRIDLPATFTKQARGHTIYMGDELLKLLDECKVRSGTSDFVFASPRTGGPISGWSKLMKPNSGKQRGRRPGFTDVSGVDFTLHDLRRTFRTGLSKLGIETDIAELALGHARSDLEARYNRDDCEAALREAFDKWEQHLVGLTRTVGGDVFS